MPAARGFGLAQPEAMNRRPLGIALLGGFLHLRADGMVGAGAALALCAGALIAAWALAETARP